MKVRYVIAALGGLLSAGAASAETVVVDDHVAVRDSAVPRPERGATMASVERKFGDPVSKHPTVGAPPITRWDYPSFSVFFERDRVIHAVVTSG
jgi:hypothetical protein